LAGCVNALQIFHTRAHTPHINTNRKCWKIQAWKAKQK